MINFQNSLKPQINFEINFSIEKYIQAFFDKIANTIYDYKQTKKDEARRLKIEKLEKERLEKINLENEKQKQDELKLKLKEQALKDEVKLDRQRAKDIKIFLRKEQALLRIEQAEKQKQFLKQLRLEKQIEKFRIRRSEEHTSELQSRSDLVCRLLLEKKKKTKPKLNNKNMHNPRTKIYTTDN